MPPTTTRTCPDCGSELILLFRFYHCPVKCSEMDARSKAALRRRNLGLSDVDHGWDLQYGEFLLPDKP